MNEEASQIIARLGLAPLPAEGGLFRETWRSAVRLAGGRAAGTAIYYLMTRDGFSALHRLAEAEVWHFYAGDPVEHLQLDPRDGAVRVTTVGADVLAGQTPQFAVAGGVWFGARLAAGGTRGWALVGCTMAPGWDEREFTLGARAELTRAWPAEAARIAALTR